MLPWNLIEVDLNLFWRTSPKVAQDTCDQCTGTGSWSLCTFHLLHSFKVVTSECEMLPNQMIVLSLTLCWCKWLPEVYGNEFPFLQNKAFIFWRSAPGRKYTHNLGNGNVLIHRIGSRKAMNAQLLLPILLVLLRTGTTCKGHLRTRLLRNRLLDSLFFILLFGSTTDWFCGPDPWEWWFILHEPLNSVQLQTTLDCSWPQAESVTENEMFWFPFSP